MSFLDGSPVWVVYLVTVVVALLAAEIGFRIGIWLKRRDPSGEGTPLTGAVVGGILGLLAFLMAFSIGIVIGQHNGRKAMVVEEANAVRTAYHRAGFLGEPDGTRSRELLREYVEVRLAVATGDAEFESSMQRSEEIHDELWATVEHHVLQGQESATMALYAEAVNEVADVHAERLAAFYLRLPTPLWIVLSSAMVLAFVVVGVASSADGKRDPLTILIFALVFVAVLMVIVDLDRPQQGLLTVSQAALSDLLRQMTAAVH